MTYKFAAFFGVIAIILVALLIFQKKNDSRPTAGPKQEIKISDYVEGMETPPPAQRR